MVKPGPKKGFHPKNELKAGHIWSPEVIAKRSRKISEALKAKGVKPPSRRGTIPWNYRGATRLHEQIRKSFEYKQWRNQVFERDDYTCQRCKSKGGVLNADHIREFAKILIEHSITSFEEALQCAILWDITNGRTLCKECHQSRKAWDKEMILLEEL